MGLAVEKRLRVMVQEAWDKNQELTEQLADAQAELDIMRADAAAIEVSLNDRIYELEQERDALQSRVDELEDDVDRAQGDAEQVTNEHEQIVTLLTDYRIYGWIDRLDAVLKLVDDVA